MSTQPAYLPSTYFDEEVVRMVGDSTSFFDQACKRSSIGKLLPNTLYIHLTALDSLESILRVYEGCGRAYLGEMEGTNLVKLHRFAGKYLDFEDDPHPTLLRSVKLCMRSRQVECLDYSQSENPPILHRKDSFLHEEHPLREKFMRLTEQEEKAGLLDETATIGTRDGWHARLNSQGFQLRGHRLIRAKLPPNSNPA
jgi:DNA phosphorothioation-associated putative methyltransferase